MIINVDTVRGIIMEMNNLSFNDIEEQYDETWYRLRIVDVVTKAIVFTEWQRTYPNIQQLKRMRRQLLDSDDIDLIAYLESMKVKVIKGAQYGRIENADDAAN